MAGRIAGITLEINGDTTKLQKALSQVDGSIRKSNTNLRDINKLLRLDPTNTELLAQKHRTLQNQISLTKDRLAQLKEADKQAKQQLANGEIGQEQYDALQREIIATEQQLASLQEQGRNTPTAIGAAFEAAGSKITAVGDKISEVGEKFLPLTAAITGLATSVTVTAADFESAMSQVQATMGITKDATSELNGETVNTMDAMESLARQMGSDTKYSASEAADAINILAMAGENTSQIYAVLPEVLNLAAAGGMEIASAADIATGVMAGFKLEAEDVGNVTDILATVASSAKGSVSDFGAGLTQVAGQASITGQGIEDMATELGILGNHNISAAEGGNMLQRVLKNLYQPTDVAAAALEELGISAYDADGNARRLPDVLKELDGKLSDLDDQAKNDVMGQIFDTAALRGAAALIEDSGDSFDELSGKINDCEGAASDMAETMEDNLNGEITVLKSQVSELAIQFGKKLIPYVGKVVSKLQELAKKFGSLNESQQNTIIKVGAVAAALGPVLIVIGKVISSVGIMISTVGKAINAVSTFVMYGNPMMVTLVGIAAAVAAVSAAVAIMDKKLGEVDGTTAALQEGTAALREEINNTGNSITQLGDTMEAQSADIDQTGVLIGVLRDRFMACYDENGNLQEGMEETAEYYLQRLNDAMGTDYSTEFIANAEDSAAALQEINSAIDDYIEKLKEQAVAEATQSDYTQALQNQSEAMDQVRAAAEDLQSAEDNLADKRQAALDAILQYGDKSLKAMEAQQDLKDAQDEVTASAEGYYEASGHYAEAAEQVKQLDDVMTALAEGDVNAAIELFGDAKTAAKDMGDSAYDSAQQAYEAFGIINDLTVTGPALDLTGGKKQGSDWAIMTADAVQTQFYRNPLKAMLGKFDGVEKATSAAIEEAQTTFDENPQEATLGSFSGELAAATTAWNNANGIIDNPMQGNVNRVNGGAAAANVSHNEQNNIIRKAMQGNVNKINGGAAAARTSHGEQVTIIRSPMQGSVNRVNGGASAARSARSEAQSYLSANPLSMVVNVTRNIVERVKSAIGRNAAGGFINNETLSWLAEGNHKEVVIPLETHRARALSLYQEAGKILGVNKVSPNYGGNLGKIGSGTQNDNRNFNINVNVYAGNGQNADEIANMAVEKANRAIRELGAAWA